MTKTKLGALLLVAGMLLAAPIVLISWLFAAPAADLTRNEQSSLESQGNELVAAIQAWKARQHRLPRSFDEAGIEAPDTRYGRWRLCVDERGERWSVEVGDYFDDGFVLYWDSQEVKWGVDT